MVNHAKHQKTTDPEYPMITHKDAKSVLINKMAEGVGFEPTEPFGSPVFKTVGIAKKR